MTAARLYPKQAAVLAAAADGAPLSEVGRRLGMPRTQVASRLSEAYRALDVGWAPRGERRAEAVRVARAAGLIPLSGPVSAAGAPEAPDAPPRPSEVATGPLSPSGDPVMPELSPLYAECASPDSIRHQIKLARANRDRWQCRVDDLARLLDRRLGQIDAGTWPPGTTSSPEAAQSGP